MSFFVISFLILFGMQAVIGLWIGYLFPALGFKIPALVAPATLTALLGLGVNYARTHYGTLESALYFACYAWGGLVFMFFFLVMALALAQWLLSFANLSSRVVMAWITLPVMAFIAVTSIYGGLKQPRLKTVDVAIPGAPSFTAAVISDSHLGVGVSLPRFERVLAQLQAQKPDILLALGDIFEYGPNRSAYAKALAAFKTPLGSYGVFGNHEYYVGAENSREFFKQAGLQLLQNQTATLPNGVQITGVNDVKTTRLTGAQVGELLAKADAQKPHIFLSHQPAYPAHAAENGVDLMLSGHTHNGQIFPFNLFVRLQYPHVYGLYELNELKLYVTSGLFYWGVPLRFFAPAEALLIRVNP